MEKDMLEQAKDYRASMDPAYAKVRPKVDAVEELTRLRLRLGLSQAEVARRMGVPPSRVNEIEARPWKVSLDLVDAYARAIDAPDPALGQ